MFPYWLLFTLCAAGALEYRRRASFQVQGGPLLFLAATLAAVLVGLRFDVGGDWENYIEIFKEYQFSKLANVLLGSDPGYALLNHFAHKLGWGIWFVNFACGVLFTWGLYKFARQQLNPWLVFVVAVPYLIIVVAMGYTRQAVAIGFVLAALASHKNASLAKIAFYIVMGATFHKTAVIVVPLLALSTTRNRVVTGGMMAVLFVMLYYLFVSADIDKFATNYEEANYDSEGAVIRVTMNLLPATIFLALYRRFNLPLADARLWRIFSYAAFGTVVMLAVLSSSTLVDRVALYLIPLQLFVLSRLPYAMGQNGQPNASVAVAVIAYSAIIQFVWLNFAGNAPAWVPYQFYPLAETDVLV